MNDPQFHQCLAEDYRSNFESLRQVEWPVTFQTYAAYAAIAIGYSYLMDLDKPAPAGATGWIAIVGTLACFCVTLYTSLRVQERMHSTRRWQNYHLRRLACHYNSTIVTRYQRKALENQAWFKINLQPIHGKWYAFAAQSIMSYLSTVGLLTYVSWRSGDALVAFFVCSCAQA